ncbi:hypothetical protein FCOIX_13287 [Fusarium coicis]|nr:hypothetical protein FCOIX_13287 [Fusarium coicis]
MQRTVTHGSATQHSTAQHGKAQPPFHQAVAIVFTQSSSLFEDTAAVAMMLCGRPASSKQSTTLSPIISSPPSLHGPNLFQPWDSVSILLSARPLLVPIP